MISGCFIRPESFADAEKVFETYLDLEMGNLVCLNQYALNFDEILTLIRRFVEKEIYFFMDGPPEDLTPERLVQGAETAGDYFLALAPLTEFGSLIYWDRDYFETLDPEVDWKVRYAKENLFDATDLVDAQRRYRDTCEKMLAERVKAYVGENAPYIVIESGLSHKHLLDYGCVFPCLEMICGNPELMFAGARGATRSHGSERWMSYIPECYLGKSGDLLRVKRFFNSYIASYIAGAGIVLRESGTFRDRGRVYERAEVASITAGYDDWDTYFNEDYESYRDVTREFHKFARQDAKPESGPRTQLAVVKGELDGFIGMWDRRVWGQLHGPEWEHGDIEREWNFLWEFYTRRPWSEAYHEGDEDFSGNPPCGQIDIMPAESPVEIWIRYETLVFLGWNTCTDELYEKMLQYVANGGKLVMSLSHMRENIKRGEPMRLFRNGDYKDLFGIAVTGPSETTVQGVRFIEDLSWCSGLPVWTVYKDGIYSTDPVCIDGPIQLAVSDSITSRVIACATKKYSPDPERPVIVENKIGKGSAVLICTWSTPGQMPMNHMMRTLLQAISAGQCDEVKFSGSDQLRYAVYGDGDSERIYIQNTDVDNSHECHVTLQGVRHRQSVPACSLVVLEFEQGQFTQKEGLAFDDVVQWKSVTV